MSTHTESKQQWSSRMGYLMACLGMCTGTGIVWRFPRVCAANGGGSSIISRPLNLTVAEAEGIWNSFLDNKLEVLIGHTVSMGIGFYVLYKGVAVGIEKVCKVLIPMIFIVLIGMAVCPFCYVVGIFSCLNINFLMNQDWVWVWRCSSPASCTAM